MNRILNGVIVFNIIISVAILCVIMATLVFAKDTNFEYARAMEQIKAHEYEAAKDNLLAVMHEHKDARAWYYYCIAMDVDTSEAWGVEYQRKYIELFENCYSGAHDQFYIEAVRVAMP